VNTFTSLIEEKVALEYGGSVRAAARDIAIAHTTLFRVRDGQSYDLDTLIKVCEWLGVNPCEVLDEKVIGRPGKVAMSFSIALSKYPALTEAFELIGEDFPILLSMVEYGAMLLFHRCPEEFDPRVTAALSLARMENDT
jgi:DNA-binding Xre family transcriptional regulator